MKKCLKERLHFNFDKTASIYKEWIKIRTSNNKRWKNNVMSMMGGSGSHYKNAKNKQFM